MPQVTIRPRDGLYADGGLLSPAPTHHGLTWAWRLLGVAGDPVPGVWTGCEGWWSPPYGHRWGSGVLTCAELDLTTTENNLAETLALLFGLEALPDGWAGTVYTDNLNALRRVLGTSTKMGGVPAHYVERLAAVRARLGPYSGVLLGGHPTKADLAKGYRARDGKSVSPHNVACDARCTALKAAWWDDRRQVLPTPKK